MGVYLNQAMKTVYFSDKSVDQLIEACVPKINRSTQINTVVSNMDIVSSGTVSINNPSGMFSNEVMEDVKNRLGTKDFYIIPSSADELLAVKKNDFISLDRLKNLLNSANELNNDTDGKKLSNNIFEYDFDLKEPIIVGEPVRESTNEQSQGYTDQLVTNAESHTVSEPSPVPHTFFHPSLEQLSQQYLLAEEDPEEDLDEDEEIHDTNYFAEYDTYSPVDFANTMVELFNYRLGNNFHLSGMDLVDNDNLVRLNMNDANNEYQNNSMDFLEYGDFLTDRYQELKDEVLSSDEINSEETTSEDEEEQESYPDDYLPFL